MRKTFVIAVREYLAAVRTKAFVITLVIMPVLMAGSLLVQWLLSGYHDTETKRIAIVDRTPGAHLYSAIEKTVQKYNHLTEDPVTKKRIAPRFELDPVPASANNAEARMEQRLQLSERVRRGELFGFLDIGAGVLDPRRGGANKADREIRYQSNRVTNKDFPRLLQEPLQEAIENLRLDAAGSQLPREQIRDLMRPAPVEVLGLTRRNPASGNVEDGGLHGRIAETAAPICLMVMMFLIIMMTASPMMQGVVEEKMQRIAEVLLGSVSPFDLMLGKLLGMTAVSLTVTGVYLGGAYWAAHHWGFDEYVSGPLLAWFVVFQTLASLMYGSLFIAVGAACTDMKETQHLLWPIMLVAMVPLFLLGSVLQEPNSAVATTVSFLPFATPMLMILRQSLSPNLPLWQPLAGMVLVLLTTLLCVWAGSRIFRVGILMQGKGAKLGDMLRWILRD
jgi:ABC-2 type transport system permease protein